MNDRALEDEEARLAAASLAAGDPTGWFDRLYAAGAAGLPDGGCMADFAAARGQGAGCSRSSAAA